MSQPTLEARLTRLERQLTAWRLVALVAVAALLLAAKPSATSGPVVLRSEDGTREAVLSPEGLSLRSGGKVFAALGSKELKGLVVADLKDGRRAVLDADALAFGTEKNPMMFLGAPGGKEPPGFQVRDAEGHPRITLFITPDGNADLELWGKTEQDKAILEVSEKLGPMALLMRADGESFTALRNDADWSGVEAIGNHGETQAQLGVGSDSAPFIRLEPREGWVREIRPEKDTQKSRTDFPKTHEPPG